MIGSKIFIVSITLLSITRAGVFDEDIRYENNGYSRYNYWIDLTINDLDRTG
jgi:hypothetical protein